MYTRAMEYYSATKKEELLPFVTTGLDLEGITLSERSPREKDKYRVIPLTRRISTHTPPNKQNGLRNQTD